jgi:uncharacterized protein YaiI (UPF0178 family)
VPKWFFHSLLVCQWEVDLLDSAQIRGSRLTASCRKQKGAATDEDTADSADVERHRGSLIVTQDIKFHCLLVAELLE